MLDQSRATPQIRHNNIGVIADEAQQKQYKYNAEWDGKQAESEREGKHKEYMSESYTKQYSDASHSRGVEARDLKVTVHGLEQELAQVR